MSPVQSIWIILSFSAVIQLAAIAMLWPALSGDFARYYSEAGAWLSGKSPYANSPREFHPFDPKLGDWRLHLYAIDHVVEHPEFASIYPPVAQLTFVIARSSEPLLPRGWLFSSGPQVTSLRQIAGRVALDRSILSLRILFSLCALTSVALLVAILHHLKKSVWWSVVFAWNPLVIIDTGAMPHVDIVGIVFLLLTILMLLNNRSLVAGIMLALACGAKPQAAILLPWLLRDIAANNPLHSRRQVARSLGGFAIACAVIYIPALAYQHGYRGFFYTLSEYSSRWEFNGS
ncbi:MAG: DUF2029 domain-containing protein, partial [Anaerolineae bacterium]|nr:DUF2029 domain-containing protein [Phycisphaerae bacterium]